VAEEQFKRAPNNAVKVWTQITDGGTSNRNESERMLDILRDMGVICHVIAIDCAVPGHYPDGFKITDADDLLVLMPRFVNNVVRRGAR
jgi:hypothetical protein